MLSIIVKRLNISSKLAVPAVKYAVCSSILFSLPTLLCGLPLSPLLFSLSLMPPVHLSLPFLLAFLSLLRSLSCCFSFSVTYLCLLSTPKVAIIPKAIIDRDRAINECGKPPLQLLLAGLFLVSSTESCFPESPPSSTPRGKNRVPESSLLKE